EKVENIMTKNGKLTLIESATCRIRYISDGFVLGEGDWVNRIIELSPEVFGKDRISGSVQMKGFFNKHNLYSARNLQKNVIQKITSMPT
ncbi:MAG: hypothetical protein ACO3YR_17500, partial [bacterium]